MQNKISIHINIILLVFFLSGNLFKVIFLYLKCIDLLLSITAKLIGSEIIRFINLQTYILSFTILHI